jgi:hypothetical protein
LKDAFTFICVSLPDVFYSVAPKRQGSGRLGIRSGSINLAFDNNGILGYN